MPSEGLPSQRLTRDAAFCLLHSPPPPALFVLVDEHQNPNGLQSGLIDLMAADSVGVT